MAVPEQQQQHSLRIGDVILLHSKEGRGYVYCDTLSSEHLILSVLPVISTDDPSIPDLRMAVFKVIAPNKNKAQERLAKLKRTKWSRSSSADHSMMLQIAEKNAKIELKNNESEQERQKGTPVLYGSTIQLLHTFTNKYVAISTTQASKTEYTNMQVHLLSHDSDNCLFRILPRYKVRSVGDEVRMEDQITFSSEKTEGQYIHTSARLFRQVGITLHENCHEINASANESGYTLRSHYHASLNEEDFIRGSSIIRLFHRELECYLAAEGSFANEKDEVVTEEVHLRKRKSEHGNLKAPSTSAITYWQIVKDKEPLNGQVLSWGERCRIKHLPTRRYLAIVKEDNGYKVTLKGRKRDSPKADLDTVFRLFPVIDEDRGIQFESYARINHPHTKTWLVARKGERYTRQTFDPNASGLASLQWDSAELIQIGIQEQMNYDDAFTIEEVDSKLVKKFTFVAGIVPVMQAYIMESSHPNIKKTSTFCKVLNELSDFMKFAHPRMKDHQKLLRNLMVLELLVQILKTYDQHDAHLHHPVYQACYKVLEVYLLGQSRKNENYLARFIDFFEQQMGMGLNTEQMLTELVRDNSLIISKFGKDKVDSIIHWLIDSKNSYFFDYLGVLCVCNDRPIPENQDNIIEKLVKQHGQELFYLTEVHRVEEVVQGSEEGGHSTKKEIHYCTPNEHRWIPLSKIAAAKGNLTDTKEYQFLVAQLDLFGKLCKGNNTSAVHTIDVEFNYLTFEEALTGAQDDNLHHALRSKYVELIVVLYVDVGSNRAILDNLSLSFVYKNIVSDPYKSAAEDPTIALTGVQNIYFPQLKDWIQHYVEQNMSVIASLVNVNNLNAEVLNLLFLLVKYGYYADINDINALITPLLSLLNGKNDKEFPYATPDENDHFTLEGRFEDNHKNRAIFRMKIMALKVMDLFFNFRFYLRLQHFIYDYKLLKGSAPNTDQQTPRPQIRPRHVSSTQQLTTRLSHQVSDTTVRVTQQITQQMTAEFNSLATRLGLVIDDYPEPPSELKRLQTHSHELKIHDKEWLMSLAVSRLKRIFSISFYNCDSAIENGLTFPQILIDLSQYNNDELLHESLYLLGRFYSAEENLFEKAIQTQLLITPESESVYNKISTLLPTLRHLAAIDVNKTRCQELVNILDDLIGLCHLEGDKNQSHEQNQKILYNTGVFADVLNIIFQEKSTRLISSDGLVESTPHIDLESTEMQQREKVLSKCLQFLKLLSRNNSVIQEHLFDHMDDLLQLDVAIPDMAGLLTEVFTGGKEICLKLKEQQVQQVFNLIVHGGTVGRAELLTMLQATVKVEELDLPLKRNQGYIIKYFSKMRENFCNDVLGLEDRKVARRKQLLLKTEDNDPVLQMLLKLIDLLASCSEGENLFIESICQNLMSINELLKILCMHNLSPSRKKPFVRFLLWVYMNTGGDKIQTGSVLLYHDPEIWSFMDHTSLMLHEFVGALKKFPELSPQPIHQSVKESVHISCKLVPDFLLYLMEGVLPMLKVFYGEYFLPYDTSDISSESNHRTSPESEVKISAAIGSSLLLMAEFIKNFIKSQDQWDLLHTTILTVLKHDCFDDEALDIDPVVRARFDQSVTYDVTTKHPLMKEYDEIYQQEILLNEEFNNFVRNYELAYWGPNTAKCQIGSPHEIPYSEFDDELLEEKGDEWLPLGPSFQKHVSCYVIHNMSESTVRHYTKRIIDCLVSSYDNLAYHNEKERQKQDRNNIKYLHLLRAIIHNEIMFINHEEEIDPVLYRKLSERIKSVQNQIQLLGNTVERIVRLLSHPNDSISAEVLAFLSTLLYAGNKTVQEGFSYLMHTREEKLFSNIQKRLQQAAINDRERRALLAQLESRLETQKVLRDTVVARSVHADTVSQLAANKEMFSCGPDITTLFLSSGAVQSKTNSTMSLEDISDVSPRKRLVSVINYRDLHHKNKQRKRRISQLNLTELLAEAGLAEDEIQLQKLQAAYEDKTSSKDGKKTDSLKFKDTSYIDLALRVLGLMCDCQYRPMQNYLREQPDNIKTINLVSEICMFLSSFYVDVTKDNIELVTRVLQTMIEMSVGNFANQQVLFNHQILDTVNRILQISIVQQCSLNKVLHLKQSAVELLEAMCEETHPGTEKLVKNIFKAVDINALYCTLVFFYQLSKDQGMKKVDKDDDAEKAVFRTYHVLVHMADFEGISLSDVEPLNVGSKHPSNMHASGVPSNSTQAQTDTDLIEAWNYCTKWSKSVELLYQNENGQKILTKIYFRTYSADELPEEVAEKIKYRVNRESPEDKVRDFLTWMKSVKKEIDHLTVLREHWYTNMFVSNLKLRNYLLILWTLVMNFMLVIAWSDVDLESGYVYNPPGEGASVTSDEALLNNYCVETSCYNNVVNDNNFTPNNCTNDLCTIVKTIVPTVPEDSRSGHWFFDYALYIGGGIHLLMSLAMVMSYFLIYSSNFVFPDIFYHYILRTERIPTYSDESLFGLRSIYHIVFVACSALSIPFYGYFYCICLLHIVIDNDILQRVLRSVTKNGRSLLWVGALGLVIIYIYSVGTFALLANEFHYPNSENNNNVRFCRSLIECFITVLDYGLLDTLGLATSLPTEFRDAALRTILYDLTFFIIVTTIGLNIVFGIIVDTFSELRDEKWRIEEDKKGYCFICNLPSYEFERRAKGFYHHVKHEHCMWHYIYFYLHLERINVNDHSAIESFAYEQIIGNKTDFFPLFHAKSLRITANETITQLTELKKMVSEVMQHFQREEKVAAVRRKQEEQAQWEKEHIVIQ